MPRTALIVNGVVKTIIEASREYQPPDGSLAVPSGNANIGDGYDGEKFIHAEMFHTPETLLNFATIQWGNIAKGGIMFDLAEPGQPSNVVSISTGSQSRQDLDDMVYLAMNDPTYQATWVDRHGAVVLTASQILRLRKAVAMHVTDTHVAYAEAVKSIKSGIAKHAKHIEEFFRGRPK